ncbi:MAG TPA: adenosine deaminase, partial [Myxococcaceae bacterium]|nr:adenosine deaminase [Myxococcaceae bacterium]
MASIRDDEIQGPTGIPSAARRTIASQPLVSSVEVSHELLKALPKTDLHCHLDGSLRLKTILELAEQQKIRLPADDEEGLAKAIHQGEVCKSLEDYLVAFDITLSVLQTEEALYRVAYELALDAAEENVRYLEVRYSPALHQQKNL